MKLWLSVNDADMVRPTAEGANVVARRESIVERILSGFDPFESNGNARFVFQFQETVSCDLKLCVGQGTPRSVVQDPGQLRNCAIIVRAARKKFEIFEQQLPI